LAGGLGRDGRCGCAASAAPNQERDNYE
jgi:hypothetical protein